MITWLIPAGIPHDRQHARGRSTSIWIRASKEVFDDLAGLSDDRQPGRRLLNSLLICLREKCSRPSTRREPFLTDELMRPVISCSARLVLVVELDQLAVDQDLGQVLRKLCATPAAMVPIASIFWTCCSCILQALALGDVGDHEDHRRLVPLHRQLFHDDLAVVQLQRLVARRFRPAVRRQPPRKAPRPVSRTLR